jgi:hypothetical protein
MRKGVARTDAQSICVVEDNTDIHQAQQPTVGRGAGAVKDGIAHAFDHLVAPFGWVLVLMVWFTLPARKICHTCEGCHVQPCWFPL